jgi:hypothetical protein
MRPSWLLLAATALLACSTSSGSPQATGTGAGTGGSGGNPACSPSDGGLMTGTFPATTKSDSSCPDPDYVESSTCATKGQTCTWTTGANSATYTCTMFQPCTPQAVVEWTAGTMTGDGCDGSECCVPCAKATPGDPCDALAFQCTYDDPTQEFPPVIALVCVQHAWFGVAECEN